MPCSLYGDISKYINQVEICTCNDLTRSDWAGLVVWSEAINHSRSISRSFSQSVNQSLVSDENVRRGVKYRDLVYSADFMPKHLSASPSVMMTKCLTVRKATAQPWRPHSEHTRSPTDDFISEKTDSQHIRFSSLNNSRCTRSPHLSNLPGTVLCCQCPRTSHEQKSSHTWWVGPRLMLFPLID